MVDRKSNKQRRAEIKQKRLARAARLQSGLPSADPRWVGAGDVSRLAGVEPADRELLARHNSTCVPLPERYLDCVFTCRDCSEDHVWTAKQQKWWYEIALGPIDSRAVRCLSCRRARRAANDRPGGHLLRELCAQLRSLGDRPPDAAAWREIEDALVNKWWGVRTTAIATLGRWGGTQAVDRLKAWGAAPLSKRWGGWDDEARRAALKALAECLPASDADWALERMLGGSGGWELRQYLLAQAVEFWESAVASEWQRNESTRLALMPWLLCGVNADAGRQQRWRARFRSHPGANVRRAAEMAWRGLV